MRRETDEKISQEIFDVKKLNCFLDAENLKDFLMLFFNSQRIKNHENESPLTESMVAGNPRNLLEVCRAHSLMVKHLICNQGLRVRFSVGPLSQVEFLIQYHKSYSL